MVCACDALRAGKRERLDGRRLLGSGLDRVDGDVSVRRFVLVGQRAITTPDFLLTDIPGTSGRLDVLLRALRAALLVSHGLRRDTVVYLVLLGGGGVARAIRVDGAAAKYVRPDERSLAVMVRKALAAAAEQTEATFVNVRPGIAVAAGGLDAVIADLDVHTAYRLEERGAEVRDAKLDLRNPVFFVGDHLGFDAATDTRLNALAPTALSVGPVSLHAEDAVALVVNELDRRAAGSTIQPS
jgi:tRNA (pseudouridine54-N1)-methyltransferase